MPDEEDALAPQHGEEDAAEARHAQGLEEVEDGAVGAPWPVVGAQVQGEGDGQPLCCFFFWCGCGR